MIAELLLAAAVVGQFPQSEVTSARTPQSSAQAQSVVEARKARRAASARRRARREVQEKIDYERELAEHQKAVKAQQDYVVKMGPIWAAEHANQIQQQRNALIAQGNEIERQKAAYQAYLLWQLRNR